MTYAPSIEDLVDNLESTKEWRERKSEEYPYDDRNKLAIENISNICNQLIKKGKCEEYVLLLSHYKSICDDDDRFSAQLEDENQYRNGIGFQSLPESSEAYLMELKNCTT